jgi:hypothetical protein
MTKEKSTFDYDESCLICVPCRGQLFIETTISKFKKDAVNFETNGERVGEVQVVYTCVHCGKITSGKDEDENFMALIIVIGNSVSAGRRSMNKVKNILGEDPTPITEGLDTVRTDYGVFVITKNLWKDGYEERFQALLEGADLSVIDLTETGIDDETLHMMIRDTVKNNTDRDIGKYISKNDIN